MIVLHHVLHLAKVSGMAIAIVIVLYNLFMLLALCLSENVRGNTKEFAKFIGVPSLIVAAILIYLCR